MSGPLGGSAAAGSARSIASRVVARVLYDGAWASRALDAELERQPGLDARDRALATELVYGSLRLLPVLKERLARHANKRLPDGDRSVFPVLVVAAHQLLVLERVPVFAAVSEAVNAVKRERGAPSAGFVNAILRKVAATGERLDVAAAAFESAPAWLRERVANVIGEGEARVLFGAHAAGAQAVAVRVTEGRAQPAWLEAAERGSASPLARLVRAAGDPRRLAGWGDGAFVVQEEGSQVVALAVGARPGDRVLDACAGHGTKASLLAARIGAEGELWAADLHAQKLAVLGREFARLGLPAPRTAAVDWSLGAGAVPEAFDRVLVDAPCSGTGTLRRRPEIALRLTPHDPARLAELSVHILRAAGQRARPGGRIVYAVCSVVREECEDVLASVADLFEPEPFDAPELGSLLAPGATTLRLLPSRHATDAYFVASLHRR